MKPHPSITRLWPWEKIALVLRRQYQSTVNEEIPDSFKRLLDKLS